MPDAMDYSHSLLPRERTYRWRAVRVIGRVGRDRASRALSASASAGIRSLPACKRCGRKGRRSMRIFTAGWYLRVEATAGDSGRGRTPEPNFVEPSARRPTTSLERGPGALEQGFQQHKQHRRRERGNPQAVAPWGIPFIERVESRCRFRSARHANSAGDRQIDRNKTSGLGRKPAVTCYSSNQQPSQWPPPLLPPRPPRC